MRAPPPPANIISCSLYEVIMRKGSRARSSWLAIWADACSLGLEASSVIGLRAMKLALGGKAAATEAQRMVSEKIEASLALQAKALSGGLGTTALSAAAKTLDHYRQKVRANQTRLAKGAVRRPNQPKRVLLSFANYIRRTKNQCWYGETEVRKLLNGKFNRRQ